MQEQKKLKIVIVNDTDLGGGGAKVSFELHKYLRNQGHTSSMVVGKKKSTDPDVYEIPNQTGAWRTSIQFLLKISGKNESKIKGLWRISKFLRFIHNPIRKMEDLLGWENYYAPGSKKFLNLIPYTPDIIHLQNIHGRYFDIRQIPTLSKKYPLIIYLHDSWLFAGHCVHSLDCEKWLTGCGECPYLDIFQRLYKDGTRHNWKVKNKIFQNSKVVWIGPSQWVLDKLNRSLATPSIISTKKIHTGINLSEFQPGNINDARKKLNLPTEAFIIFFAASTIKNNPWKDYPTMEKAIHLMNQSRYSQLIYFLALGEQNEPILMDNCQIHFKPYISDPKQMPDFYIAADLYLHGARADTFPTTILESFACGTPVVGTAVCGIPEEIKGLKEAPLQTKIAGNRYSVEEANGILVPPGDAKSMAQALKYLQKNPDVKVALEKNARADAEKRFDEKKQMSEILSVHYEVLKRKQEKPLPNSSL